jgi:hypothetical protein
MSTVFVRPEAFRWWTVERVWGGLGEAVTHQRINTELALRWVTLR